MRGNGVNQGTYSPVGQEINHQKATEQSNNYDNRDIGMMRADLGSAWPQPSRCNLSVDVTTVYLPMWSQSWAPGHPVSLPSFS